MSGDLPHGRTAELEAVSAALDAVARGDRRLVAVRGEAGIGKTHLLGALADAARAQRFAIFAGRATELERDVPFVPIVDAFAAQLASASPLAELLGADRAELLAPVLFGGEASRGTSTERWRVHRALGELLAVLAADRPTLLLVDDVHWADPATLELLEHLVRRPPSDGLLVAVGLRPGSAAERLLVAQRAGGTVGLVDLRLAPLERDAAEALLVDLPAGAERDRCYARSGGNPLLLRALVAAPETEVPGSVAAAIGRELDALPSAARALAEAGAIVGDPFDVDLAAEVGTLDAAATAAALDALEAAQLVRESADPRRFAFRHPVVRSAVYEGLGAGSRLAGHAAAARALERAGAPLGRRAQHLAHGAAVGDTEGAATLRRAAQAVRGSSPGVAADWLLAARRVDPGGDRPGVLAATLVEAGRLDAALAVVDEEHPDVDAQERVRIAVAGASVERALGRHDAAQRRLRAALEVGGTDPALLARVRVDLAVAAYQRGDYVEMREWASRVAIEDGGAPTPGAIAATLLALGDVFVGDDVAAGVGVVAALHGLRAADDADLAAAAEPAMAISWGLLALDRTADGLAAAQRLAAAARAAGNGLAAIPHDLAAILALVLLGRLVEADALADDVEQAARVSGNPQLVQWTLWLCGWVAMERGRLDAALSAATESVELAQGLDDSASAIVARAVLGAVLAARGEHGAARDLLAAYDIDRGWICRHAPTLVECDLALDDHAAAIRHAARAAELAPASGMAGARAAAARAQGLLALAEGDGVGAAELARAAVREASVAGAALEEARDRLLLGRAIVGADQEAGAAELLAAATGAARCGAPRVEAEARRALRRAGVRVGAGGARATGGAGLNALSGREREVAELVADGLTNREIGQRLFLSEKTIETHLGHVFQKLGLRSRTQVAALVARER